MRSTRFLACAASVFLANPAWSSDFRDSKYGYTVSPPAFSGANGASFTRLLVNGPFEAGFSPNMNVMVQEIKTTREQFMALSEGQFAAVGMTLKSTAKREVSGKPAVLAEYEGSVQGRALRFLSLAVVLPERVLLVTYTAPVAEFAGLEADFRRSLESFKLTGSPDVPVSPVVIRGARVEGDPPRDPGIDTAVVRVPLAALREGASSTARVILQARQGTMLALVSREASGGFYSVIEIESGKQGFVRAEEVEVRFTTQPRAASPFQAQRVDDTSPPALTIKNDSDRTMTLTLDAQVFSIAPRSERTITWRPGRVSYVAGAPGVIPAMGTDEFAQGYVYSWRFWISSR